MPGRGGPRLPALVGILNPDATAPAALASKVPHQEPLCKPGGYFVRASYLRHTKRAAQPGHNHTHHFLKMVCASGAGAAPTPKLLGSKVRKEPRQRAGSWMEG